MMAGSLQSSWGPEVPLPMGLPQLCGGAQAWPLDIFNGVGPQRAKRAADMPKANSGDSGQLPGVVLH